MALLEKFFDKSLADETGAACDKYIHGFLRSVAFRDALRF